MNPLFITIAVFCAVSAIVALLAFWLRGGDDSSVETRLDQLTGARGGAGAKESLLSQSGVLSQPLDATQGILAEFLARFKNLKFWFEQANVSMSPARFAVLCGVLSGVGMVVAVVTHLHPAAIPVIGCFSASLPVLWLMMRRRKRFKTFAKQLPDALELISRALRAGHSLGSGFNLVSQESSDPIAGEFQRVFEEQNLGIPLDEALKGMTLRMPNLDLKFFATAVVLQRQTGGDLAEILDKIGRLVRDRFQVWGQVQALTGEGRLSGIVLLALPPCLFLAVYKLNPDYVMPLFTDPLGQQMLAGGVVLQVLGALVIKKIVNIKV